MPELLATSERLILPILSVAGSMVEGTVFADDDGAAYLDRALAETLA